jgi:formaldehyde-activating enzyme involved in methanogenesis
MESAILKAHADEIKRAMSRAMQSVPELTKTKAARIRIERPWFIYQQTPLLPSLPTSSVFHVNG